jgi:hypothetical protein
MDRAADVKARLVSKAAQMVVKAPSAIPPSLNQITSTNITSITMNSMYVPFFLNENFGEFCEKLGVFFFGLVMVFFGPQIRWFEKILRVLFFLGINVFSLCPGVSEKYFGHS